MTEVGAYGRPPAFHESGRSTTKRYADPPPSCSNLSLFRSESLLKSWSFAAPLLAALIAAACMQESKMAEQDPVTAMATAYTAAWCSQNPASVASHYAENGSLAINDGTPAVGRSAITESARAFMTSLPDMVVAMDSLRVDGRSARYHWTLTGTNTGPGGTGNAVQVSGYEEWTLDANNQIQRSLGHFDAQEYARQIREGVRRSP